MVNLTWSLGANDENLSCGYLNECHKLKFSTLTPYMMKDKDLTKRRMIDAVGSIIANKGFNGLRISKIAHVAGVDRKLVYRYFGSLDNLIEAYVTENDYWMLFASQLKALSGEVDSADGRRLIAEILQQLFKFFLEEPESQELILMELTGTNPLMRSIHNARESIGQEFFNRTDQFFHDKPVNFRAISALLVGGIYYIVLHTRKNGYIFADTNLKSQDGMKAILEAISQVVEWSFQAAQ
ncbi:hypothetical protein A0256_13465 [Mucilaginibacter sp. PAMC 26640]|nr:hypothetical protein A0256_13465 [Mucilaginibacter sp. PAMC 26640]